ncbi:MAG: hypothetical protein JSS02_25225 [Planctomycetes bacterium]|nr:hypothetical protein [Planctomycetota bacterium]
MWHFSQVLARGADSPANQWLKEHPEVLGLIFLVIGAILAFTGVSSLMSGEARGKWGTRHSGGMARFIGLIRLVAGIGAGIFGIYQMVAG